MKQKNCFLAVAATMLLAAASFTSCSNQDNVVYDPSSEPVVPDAFDEGSLIKNGRCEGTETANFVVKEWRDGVEFQGAPNFKWDEEIPRNHAIVVDVRGGDNLTAWDTQFFITVPEDQIFEPKDKIRLTMKVKADEAVKIDAQTHANPGEYIGNLNSFNATTEWTEFDTDWVVLTEGQAIGMDFDWSTFTSTPNGKLFHTIAFNLSNGNQNRIFFDDIRLEVIRHDKWFDDNILTNGRIEEEGEGQMINYTSAEWIDGQKIAASADKPGNARRVVDPLDKKNHCIEVISRDPAGASIDNWDTQFFVTMPEAVNEGDKFLFECRVRAEKAADSETQAHTAPTAYKHWDFVGHIPFTTEWTKFEKEVTVAANQAGCNTIAVNLAVFKEANKYYFDDIKIKIIEKAKPVENWETLCEYKGDDASGFSVKYFKYYTDAAKVVDGAIVVESLDPNKTYAEYGDATLAQDWDTQFLIPLPKKVAAGTKAKITLKLKADKEIKQVDSQSHGAIPAAGSIEGVNGYEGTYLYYDLFGKVDFLTDWATFEKEFTVPNDGDGKIEANGGIQSICFNLEKLREINKYYFKEIKVEIAK